MAETHEANLTDGNRKTQVIVEDTESLESARLFKFVSDAVWAQRPTGWAWADFGTRSTLEPSEALTRANEEMGAIEERLVLAGPGRTKDLRISGGRDEHAKISRKTLAVPEAATLTTFAWDDRRTGRTILVDGEKRYAVFSDGHHDYHRELLVGFEFARKQETLNVGYAMQRNQWEQDRPTELRSNVWYSRFAESGYEGNTLRVIELTEEQEIAVLRVFADIGGIAINDFVIS